MNDFIGDLLSPEVSASSSAAEVAVDTTTVTATSTTTLSSDVAVESTTGNSCNDDDVTEPFLSTTINEALELQLNNLPSLVDDIDTQKYTPVTVTTVNDSIDNNIEPFTPYDGYDNYDDEYYNNENWIDPYPINTDNDTNENRYNDLVSFTNEDLMSVLRSLQDTTTDVTNGNDENGNVDIDWIKPILDNNDTIFTNNINNNNSNQLNNSVPSTENTNNNSNRNDDTSRNFENIVFVDGNTILSNNSTIVSNHYSNQQYNNLNTVFDTTILEFTSVDDYYPTINDTGNSMLDDNDNVYTLDNEPFSKMMENTTFGQFYTLDGININSELNTIDDNDNMFLPPLDVSNLEYINNDLDNDDGDYIINKYEDDIMEDIIIKGGGGDDDIDDDTNMFDLGNIDTIFDDFDDAANTNTNMYPIIHDKNLENTSIVTNDNNNNNNNNNTKHNVDDSINTNTDTNNDSNDVMNLIDQIQTMGINDANTYHETSNSILNNNNNIASNYDSKNNNIDYNDDYITKNLMLDNDELLESYFDSNDINDFDFFQTISQSIMTPPYDYCQPCTTTLTTITTETISTDDVLDQQQAQLLPKTLTNDDDKLRSSTSDEQSNLAHDDKTKPDNNNIDTLIQNFASTGLDENSKNKNKNNNKEIGICNTKNDNNEPGEEELEEEEIINEDEHDDADQSIEKTANRPLSEMIHKKSISSTKTKKQQRQQQQQKKASLTLKQQQQQSSQKSKIVAKQQQQTAVQDDTESKAISLSENATDQKTKNAYLDTDELYCLPCSTTFNEVTEEVPSRAEPTVLTRSTEDVISILDASINVVASFNVQYNETYLHTISSDYNVSYDTIDTVIDTLATLQKEQQQQVQQLNPITTSTATGADETDVNTISNRKTCVGHHERILGCDLSECGMYLATASQDSTIMIWDASTGMCLSKLLFNDEYEMLRVKWASSKWGQNTLHRPHSCSNNNSNNKDTDVDNDITNLYFTYMLAAGGADGNVHLYGTDNPTNDNWQKYCTLNHASFSHYDTNLAQDSKDKPQIYSLQFIDNWRTMFTSTTGSTSTDENTNVHTEEKYYFLMPTNVQNSFLLTTSDDHIHLWEVKNCIYTINESNTTKELTTDLINLSEVYSIRFSSWEDDYTYGVTVCHVTDSSIFGPRGKQGGDEENKEVHGSHNTAKNKSTVGGDRNPHNLVYVFYAEYCTTNNLLAAALSDGTIRLMNWRGVCLSVFQLPGVTQNQRYGLSHLTSFDWDSTGQRLATCVANGSIVTWHVHNLLSQDGIGERLKNTCCSILSGGHEYGKPLFGVQYINVDTTTSIGNTDDNRIGSRGSQDTMDDQLMISWGYDGQICLWDSHSEDTITSPIAALFHQPRYPIYALSSKKVQYNTVTTNHVDNTNHMIRIAVAGGEPPENCSDGVSVYVYDVQLSTTTPKMAPLL